MVKKKMTTYGRITNKAMKVILVDGTKLNKTDKFILFTLIVKQGSSDAAHIANELLADISGLTVRTIQRSVKRLEEAELISKLRTGIYQVHKDYMYKKGQGFGTVNWDIMRSDLSIEAKLRIN